MKESEELARIPPRSAETDYASTEFYDEYGYQRDDQSGSSHNLRRYWLAFRKRMWIILLITVVGTLVAIVHVAQKPDYYIAKARVQVNRELTPGMDINKSNSVVVSSVDNDPAYFSTQFQILEGSGLLRRVVKSYDLEHNRTFINPLAGRKRTVWQNVERFLGIGEAEKPVEMAKEDTLQLKPENSADEYKDAQDDAEKLAPFVGLLKRGLDVSPVKEKRVSWSETRLIDIEFTHNDPRIAPMVANAIADTYVLLNLEKKIEANSATGDFLQKRIAELQVQIRTSEERLLNYSKDHQLISLDASQNTVVQRLTELSNKLLEAENERHIAEAAYRASLAPGAATALTESGDAQSTQLSTQLETKLIELRQQRELLLSEYKEDAPEVKDLDRQIAAMEASIRDRRNRATNTLTTNLETKYRQALARENEMKRLFNQQRGEVLSQNEAAINYRIIQQEIETNKKLLDDLLQRSKENDVILNDTPNNVLVLDRALIQRSPAGPKRSGAVLMAFFASLGLGAGLAFLLQYLDDTIREAGEVEDALRLPVIAAIPSAVKHGSLRKLLPKRGGRRNKDLQALAIINKDSAPSIYNESYLHLRTSILLATAGGPPKKLLVTSSQPSEGKTTTAINLALVLAQTGARVLLIDSDLRGPSLHSLFDLDNRKGLTSLLTAKDPSQDMILSNVIQKDEESGLFILPTGPTPPNPANLLGSEQMRALIDMLAVNFTHIIIDSPPLVMFTDSAILSTYVDGTLLVVRSGETSRAGVLRGRKILRDIGAKVFGVVLNDVPSSENNYYSHDYYHYNDMVKSREGSVLDLS